MSYPFEPIPKRWRAHTGLGLEPMDDGGDGGAGAIIGAIIAGIGAIFGFGGDDQSTRYRPPANSGETFVEFDDEHGFEEVAYEVSSASLAESRRRGNRDEDIFSYYSAFVSGSARAGASSAARRVVEDAARNNGISIRRAADWILRTAGILRRVRPRSRAPQPSSPPPTGAQLQPPQAQQPPQALCPPSYAPNYQLRRCEPIQFPLTGSTTTVVTEQVTPWWVWLLVGLVAVQAVKDQ